MSTTSDRYYYTQRAAEERRLARNASHPSARATHLELARKYDERAASSSQGYEQAAPNAMSGATAA